MKKKAKPTRPTETKPQALLQLALNHCAGQIAAGAVEVKMSDVVKLLRQTTAAAPNQQPPYTDIFWCEPGEQEKREAEETRLGRQLNETERAELHQHHKEERCTASPQQPNTPSKPTKRT